MADYEDDIQTDCAPSINPAYRGMDPLIARRLNSSFHKTNDKSRIDSGIESIESGYRSGEGFSLVEPTLDSVSEVGDQMCKMAIEEQESEPTDISKSALHVHEDEGYHTKSLQDSIDIDQAWNVEMLQDKFGLHSPVAPCPEAIDAYSQDDDGDTQLHMAIIQLSENIALQLIDLAPNHDWLNLVNTLLQTPLHLAVITHQQRVVRRLMAAGASVDVRDQHGNTPLHIACREGYHEIVERLLDPVRHDETKTNQYEIPYQRIPQDLEAKNYEGHTPFHLAALGCHIRVMKILLSKRAKINAQDGKSGRTVLHYAAEAGNRILLEFLLSCRDLDLNSCTYGGLTPVILAAGRRFGDVVAILQSHGADMSSLLEEEDEEDEDMIDDFCLNGQPLSVR